MDENSLPLVSLSLTDAVATAIPVTPIPTAPVAETATVVPAAELSPGELARPRVGAPAPALLPEQSADPDAPQFVHAAARDADFEHTSIDPADIRADLTTLSIELAVMRAILEKYCPELRA
jgi:hypothetical protein